MPNEQVVPASAQGGGAKKTRVVPYWHLQAARRLFRVVCLGAGSAFLAIQRLG